VPSQVRRLFKNMIKKLQVKPKIEIMSKLYHQNPVTIGLEHLFADSIIPQLFVDSEMVLRDFTPPIARLFSITSEDKGKSIYEVNGKIGHRCLIGNIKGVIYTERSMEKEVTTDKEECFRMSIQPNFSPGEEEVDGVLITFFATENMDAKGSNGIPEMQEKEV
jgi:hypothetical protein